MCRMKRVITRCPVVDQGSLSRYIPCQTQQEPLQTYTNV